MKSSSRLNLATLALAGLLIVPAAASADIPGGKGVRSSLKTKFNLGHPYIRTTLVIQPPAKDKTDIYQVRSGVFWDNPTGKSGFFRMTSYRDPKKAPTLNVSRPGATNHAASWAPAVKDLLKAELPQLAGAKIVLRTTNEWRPPWSEKTDIFMLRSGVFTTKDATGKQISGNVSFALLRNGVIELRSVEIAKGRR